VIVCAGFFQSNRPYMDLYLWLRPVRRPA